jgi:hypothetical protein
MYCLEALFSGVFPALELEKCSIATSFSVMHWFACLEGMPDEHLVSRIIEE